MPYKSEAQRKYFNANKDKLGKKMVEHWNKETGNKPLPKKVSKKKKQKERKKHKNWINRRRWT